MTAPTPEKTPNPGSEAALLAGCTCPVFDNGHGRGHVSVHTGETIFIYTVGCPVHPYLREVSA